VLAADGLRAIVKTEPAAIVKTVGSDSRGGRLHALMVVVILSVFVCLWRAL